MSKFPSIGVKTAFIFLFLILACSGRPERSSHLIISEIPKQVTVPVFVLIDSLTGNNYAITSKSEKGEIQIPFQREGNRLWFNWAPQATDRNIDYFIQKIPDFNTDQPRLTATKINGDLQLSLEGKPLISYRYEMTYPPVGVDSIFGKSGYIHPVRTPKGDTLSRIQPPDHYHHYGVWGPWTHTQIKGHQVDFWNLGDRKGTVLFKDFVNHTSGNIFASLEAVQEHIDLITEKEPQLALHENLKVTLWNLDRPDRYMFDYTTTFRTPLSSGILFEAYRYGGGIGMRFTERWHSGNSSVLTSEGHDRSTADGTKARWCIVSGETADGGGRSGILFLSHPNNREHPEPMRVWPIDANEGRGDLLFEFSPIRNKEWPIRPKEEYRLKYRMVVFDGEIRSEEAEAYWQAFANPPKVGLGID